MSKIDSKFPEITLVCVSNIRKVASAFALSRSCRKISFGAVKLITTEKFPPLPAIQIEKPTNSALGSVDEYSHFMLYDLWAHIETKWALVIQWDGYVLNPKVWHSGFFDFDYIGAPWPVIDGLFIQPDGSRSRVGNGGFSFRSRKLMEVPNSHAVVWDTSVGDFYRHTGRLSEDGSICVHNRAVYEAAGCNFAPLETALAFSVEEPVPEFNGGPTFGFHKHLPKRYWAREALALLRFLPVYFFYWVGTAMAKGKN